MLSNCSQMYVDTVSRVGKCGVGVLLTSSQGDKLPYALKCGFTMIGNEVEYEALIASFQITSRLDVTHFFQLLIFTNNCQSSPAKLSS